MIGRKTENKAGTRQQMKAQKMKASKARQQKMIEIYLAGKHQKKSTQKQNTNESK